MTRNQQTRHSSVFAIVLVLALAPETAVAQFTNLVGEWRAFGAVPTNTKYSPLSQIDADNFGDLEVVWRWTSISADVTAERDDIQAGQFKATPLMVGGLVYVSTPLGQVAAVNAGTGELVWKFDPRSYERIDRPANAGWQHRGVSYWADSDSEDARIFIATHDLRLVALNARTGSLYSGFGENGTVDLSGSLGQPIDRTRITHSSPVAIVRDTVVVGSIVADLDANRGSPPGHVRGFDARTGAMKWIFHTIPQGDEFGVDSWQNDSSRHMGNTNVWSFMAVDEELGYVYLPIGTPTNDWYGGMRPGDNLFAESIVCLDGETGKRVWHFQAVHHGLWDYDFPTAANLVDITVGGRDIKALAQISKQAFTYVLDRETGEPVWPIVERPVPAGNVPGEWYSETQPFPTKPLPYDRQGITADDVIDFTPELKTEALAIADRAQFGPLFSPPVARGTGKPIIQIPGDNGGANWPGAAFDPETDRLFVPSFTHPTVVELIEYPENTGIGWFAESWATAMPGPQGLPLVKPPYRRITAIDLTTGDHRWMSPHGDGPRNHPALQALDLPPLGGGPLDFGLLLTKTLLIATHGARHVSNDESVTGYRGISYLRDVARAITAYDKDTGAHLGSVALPTVPTGNPVTYLHNDRQYIVIATGGGGQSTPELVALSLPE